MKVELILCFGHFTLFVNINSFLQPFVSGFLLALSIVLQYITARLGHDVANDLLAVPKASDRQNC